MQKIIGSFLCYGRTIDTTIIKALNTLATKQAKAIEKNRSFSQFFLDYCATHPDAKIRFLPPTHSLK